MVRRERNPHWKDPEVEQREIVRGQRVAGQQPEAANGIAVYSKTSGTTTDRLTMLAANVAGYNSAAPQYSGLAYWQRYSVSGTGEATTFDIFTYGLDTPASAVPRTGQAAYATTVVGLDVAAEIYRDRKPQKIAVKLVAP
mgnify:CR=1 FL=1